MEEEVSPSRVVLAIISDLHVFGDEIPAKQPSFLSSDAARDNPKQHPITGLRQLIEAESLQSDLLLCPGDMCNQASSAGLMYAWEELHKIGSQLGAHLIATAGNHDLDSRLRDGYDPKDALASLSPRFPFDSQDAGDHYWARNYAILERANCLIVTLNSCAYHGYHSEQRAKREFEHGRISPRTLDSMLGELQKAGNNVQHKILLCHHHPQRIGGIPEQDYDEMLDGHQLLAALPSSGSWLVVHGHRHFPYLSYAAGGGSAPVVFSAGSFAAIIPPEWTGRARNQFYIIELLTPDEAQGLSLELAGTFRAWDWAHNVGWVAATEASGLPAAGGFGYRGGARLAAKTIQDWLSQVSRKNADWSEVVAGRPELSYLLPSDVELVRTELEHLNLRGLVQSGQFVEVGAAP